MIVLLSFMLAAAPQAETLGSVDGPFLVAETHASVETVNFTSRSPFSYFPLAATYAGGHHVLVQGQLVGGWGVRVLKQRLAFTVSSAATGLVTSPLLREFPRNFPQFHIAPVLLSAAVPIPIDGVVVVPILGVTIPTRNSFGNDPIVSLQPQLRFRTSFGSFTLGVNSLLNVPVVTKWTPCDSDDQVEIRCPPDETRCRWPVTREYWLASLSVQGEYWFTNELSAGVRTKLEFRDENSGKLANPSGSPEGRVVMPAWSVAGLQETLFGSWAFSRFVGLSASFGLSSEQRVQQPEQVTLDGTGWNASLSLWLRTDSRLGRFWLDR